MKTASKRRLTNHANIENNKENAQTNHVTNATKNTNFTIHQQSSLIQHHRRFEVNNSSASTLTTFFSGTDLCSGSMFDIKTFKDVAISFFEIHTELRTNVSYFVYTRSESYENDTLNPNRWTLISRGEVQGMGKGNAIATNSLSPSLFLPSNTTQAFYITLDRENLLSTASNDEGSTVASDSSLEIRQGIALNSFPFGPVIYRQRIFNGAIHYSVIDREIVTNSENGNVTDSTQILQASQIPSPSPTSTISLNTSHSPTTNNTLQSSKNYEGNRKRIHEMQPTFSSDVNMTLEQKNETSNPEIIEISWAQTTDIPFFFTMQGDLNFTNSEVILNAFNLAIEERLFSTLFQSGNVKNDQLEVISVDTNIIKSPTFQQLYCKEDPQEDKKCLAITSVVKIGHNNAISSAHVHTLLHTLSEQILDDFKFPNVHVVNVAVSQMKTSFYICLYEVDSDNGLHNLTEMNPTTIVKFEKETNSFLNQYFKYVKSTIYIHQVQVLNQDMATITVSLLRDNSVHNGTQHVRQSIYPSHLRSAGPYLSSRGLNDEHLQVMTKSIIISVGIEGEYQPPPELNFSSETRNAILENSEIYLKELALDCFPNRSLGMNIYQSFEMVQKDVEVTQNNLPTSSTPFDYRYLYSLLGLPVIIAVCLYSRKVRKTSNASLNKSIRNLRMRFKGDNDPVLTPAIYRRLSMSVRHIKKKPKRSRSSKSSKK